MLALSLLRDDRQLVDSLHKMQLLPAGLSKTIRRTLRLALQSRFPAEEDQGITLVSQPGHCQAGSPGLDAPQKYQASLSISLYSQSFSVFTP